MTTAKTNRAPTLEHDHIVFPDPPKGTPEDMTSFDHLAATGSVHHLIHHFGNPETTLIAGEHYLSPIPTRTLGGVRYPDLLIAFDVDPAAYVRTNAYVVSEQGKPPDFILEIASPKTGRIDTGPKREEYAALGVAEYWRFDETGRFHGERLAGDRLVSGEYEPIAIDRLDLDGDVLQGYSPVLNLHLRWEQGQLRWFDPTTGRHIATFEDERAARIQAESRANSAEARVRELEAEMRRLRDPQSDV